MEKDFNYYNNYVDSLINERKLTVVRVGNCHSRKCKTIFKCSACNRQCETTINSLVRCKSGCVGCAKHAPLSNEIVDRKLEGRKIKRLSEYKTARLPMQWQCCVCSHIWTSACDNIVRGGKGCAACDGQLQVTNEYTDAKLKKNNPNVIRIGNVVNSKKHCKFKCLKCANEWDASLGNVYREKNPAGCPKCVYKREAFVHDKIIEILPGKLQKPHYYFTHNNKRFNVDFYLKINNKDVFIEYNGEQHYKVVDFTKNKEINERNFKERVERDKNLRETCKELNILLLELPYTLTDEQIKQQLVGLKEV